MARKFTFYALARKENPDVFLTISADKKVLKEYVRRYLIINNYDHFKMWCDIHEKNPDTKSAWDEYIESCVDTSEISSFMVKKMQYDTPTMASILRMFSGCLPLGCSFEKQIEQVYFNDKVTQQKRFIELTESITDIKNQIKKEVEEAVKDGSK